MSAPALCSPTRTGVLTGADADAALAGMGLSESLLTGACAGGIRTALGLYSPLKPPTAFGSTLWFEIVGGLRAALSVEGWTQMDVLNASRAVSPDGTLSIGAVGGDEATGRPGRGPRNARGRGRAFIEEVLADETPSTSRLTAHQLVLDLLPDLLDRPSGGPRAWLLLYHWDAARARVRLELSLPVAVDDGVVTVWETRILLPPVRLTAPELSGLGEPLPDDVVDFVVRRA